MKGAAAIIAVVMMFAILTALFVAYGPTLNLFGGGDGTLHKTDLQSDIYTMGHALDAAKLYMDTSLNYAVYQACYDNLQRAGLSEITPETGQSGLAYLPILNFAEFYNNMATTAETYINRYSDESYAFLSEYRVSLPSSTVIVTKEDEEDKFIVTSLPKSMMETYTQAGSGESVTLRASADLSKTYEMPCYPIYRKAAETNDEVLGFLQNTLSSAAEDIGERITNSETSCNSAGICGDLTNRLGEIIAGAAGTAPQDDEYLIETEMTDYNVIIDLVDSGKIKQFSISMTQVVRIQEKEPTYYPVWNGTDISFESMELVYLTGLTASTEIEDSG